MLHEKIELRRLLKEMLMGMNDIPFELRDVEIKRLRTMITVLADKLGKEIYQGLKQIDNTI